ncbi:MAG: SatD family protein [Saprospiraceae bacterium]|nr:SatD family protein [Saprospiraceae bacterium]
MKKEDKYIILMADIIDSRYEDGVELMQSFSRIVRDINNEHGSVLLSPLTITLGDEFQGVAISLAEALSVTIYLEEEIIARNAGFKMRYAISEGAIDTSINPRSAHGMLGSGLTRTRELLSQLKDSSSRWAIEIFNKEKSRALSEAFLLYQWLVDDWKEKDYELLSAFWRYQDYKKVAEVLNKDVSLMWRREKSLNLREYEAIKNVLNYMA